MMENNFHLMFIFPFLDNEFHLIYDSDNVVGYVQHLYPGEMHQEVDVISIEP